MLHAYDRGSCCDTSMNQAAREVHLGQMKEIRKKKADVGARIQRELGLLGDDDAGNDDMSKETMEDASMRRTLTLCGLCSRGYGYAVGCHMRRTLTLCGLCSRGYGYTVGCHMRRTLTLCVSNFTKQLYSLPHPFSKEKIDDLTSQLSMLEAEMMVERVRMATHLLDSISAHEVYS